METQDLKIELRNLHLNDYDALLETANACYAEISVESWEKGKIKTLIKNFPEGQLCVTVNDKVVAVALSIVVDYDKFDNRHTYRSITGNETFSTHEAMGNTLYGIEVFVHPEYRGMRLARRLYDARKVLCENLNLRAILLGGRMSNYAAYANTLSPKEYLEKVKDNEIHDKVLHFQMSNDFHVRKVMRGYLPGDTDSKDYAALMEWNNIYYEEKEEEPHFNQQKSVVRIGLVQWQMRELTGFDSLVNYIDYFVDAVSAYQSDFVLFPELFNAPLMQAYNNLGESQAIRQLATYTEQLREVFVEKAVSYNINIVTGSMPIIREENLYNISYLCRRDGS